MNSYSVDDNFFLDYTNLQISGMVSNTVILQIFQKAIITRMESEQELYRNTANSFQTDAKINATIQNFRFIMRIKYRPFWIYFL